MDLAELANEFWKKRIETDSALFVNQEASKEIISKGYARIDNVYRQLHSLGDRIQIDSLDWEKDPILKGIHVAYGKIDYCNKRARKTARSVFRRMTFEEDEQLISLTALFDCMPSPRTDSVESLRISTYGDLQFPRLYLRRLLFAIDYAMDNYYEQGATWNPNAFEKTLNSMIKKYTSGEMFPGNVSVSIRTVPGSYESAKR